MLTTDGSKNSSRNVTLCTRAILIDAFTRARDAIIQSDITAIFQENDFFAGYASFLQVAVEAVGAQEFDLLASWIGTTC